MLSKIPSTFFKKTQTIDVLYPHPIYAYVLTGVLQMSVEYMNVIQARLVTSDFPSI